MLRSFCLDASSLLVFLFGGMDWSVFLRLFLCSTAAVNLLLALGVDRQRGLLLMRPRRSVGTRLLFVHLKGVVPAPPPLMEM